MIREYRGIPLNGSGFVFGRGYLCGYKQAYIGGFDFEFTPVIESTIGQFTGLLDRDQVKIFEGDIVGFGDDSPTCKSGMYGELGTVAFSESDACYVVVLASSGREVQLADHLLFSDRHVSRKVYGNVHQNSELIKE
ncbi:hypothetical protein I3271_07450 [Photobacterium leiognathi]|uniref:YopX family protein n=1 Tax=Photobacterium leiognathi TaxID=553611 RepID=UPI001EDD1E07|nr:YopX family protein [Photobacterium leiognathi]MCG3884521.1 hypothetical protein [Photobacterium leiognathi]